MLHYILQVIAFQLGFLIVYDLCLRKETFFNWNRAYLLGTALLSLIIPFIKIDSIKTAIPETFIVHLPEVIIGEASAVHSVTSDITNLSGTTIPAKAMMPTWEIILYAGMSIAFFIMLIKIFKLVVLYYKHPKRWHKDLLIVKLFNSTSAFSFFHYVFLGEDIHEKDKAAILEHERVHVTQKHTIDLLFFEILRIVFWFNPLVYMYQTRIATLHEYIADAKAIKHNNKSDYYNNLLAQVFETQQFSFVNPFFKQSLIKKRIAMLSKTKSKQIHTMKYALLIPAVCAMLVYTSSYAKEKLNQQTPSSNEQITSDDEKLKEKFYDEFVSMEENGASFMEIADSVLKQNDKYILSREEYMKLTAYMHYISDSSMRRKVEKGDVSQEDIDRSQAMKSKFSKTYEEYVAWKQTNEAKETWENNTRDGVLKLLVEDASNMTEEEKRKMNHKLDMIERDDYFQKLLIVDVEGRTKMILQNPKSSGTNKDVRVVPVEESIEVPFAIIDQVPVMSECQDMTTNEGMKTCMSQKIASHVNKNFNTEIAKKLGLTGKLRIAVIFKIDTQGDVIDIKARAPHPDLEKEAIRVINLLPQFKPGLQKGQPVIVPYSLPILFQVKEDTKIVKPQEKVVEPVEVETIELSEPTKLIDVPFAIIEIPPKYEGCENITVRDDIINCTSQGVAKFVNHNFNIKLAASLGLSGKQRINVMFKIDKEGYITGVRARASHPKLEEEAIRVIKLLPKFTPGVHEGETVIVPYSLPIIFQIAEDKGKSKKN